MPLKLPLHVPYFQVVRVHPITRLDIAAGKTDHLSVADNRLPLGRIARASLCPLGMSWRVSQFCSSSARGVPAGMFCRAIATLSAGWSRMANSPS